MTEPTSPTPHPPATRVDLGHRFRRLHPDALAAILEYQRTPAPALVPVIVTGILNHYLPADTAALFTSPTASDGGDQPETGQAPALEVDSLTMLEIVLDLEDALGVEFDKPELTSIRTALEMYALLLRKVQAKSQSEHLSPGEPGESASENNAGHERPPG